MAFMSDRELALVKSNMASQQNKIQKLQNKVFQAGLTNKLLTVGEGLGGAAVVGFARGKMEDAATGQWNIPGTTIDIEAVVVLGLAGVALAGDAVGLSKMQEHAANLCAGVGGHYVGQIARKYAKTKSFSMVAGLPPYDPTSYNPTQYAAPYDDPSASALASSGI